MTKVLIALDYNPTAQKVAETGFQMAKSMDAEIVLLHVISDPVFYASADYSPIMGFDGFMETSQMQFNNLDALKKAALHFLDKTRLHLGDSSIEILIDEGDFAESILKNAKEVHAGIIVIGSHSHRWLENIVMGSVSEKVLRNTTLPLLMVPTKKA